MATYERRCGAWRVKVHRKGVKATATFKTKLQAQEWAARVESDAIQGQYRARARDTLGEVLKRFVRDVSPNRLGHRWESLRLASFQEREKRLCALPLSSLDVSALEDWRDRRLSEVSASTVRREIALLGAVLSQAVRWGLIRGNPFKDVKKPAEPAARRRGVSDAEIAALGVYLQGFAGKQAYQAFLLSLETGMRAGEILGLTWDHVDLAQRVVTLPKTKNGDSRQVPLSKAAVSILQMMWPKDHLADRVIDEKPVLGVLHPVFTITGPTLDVLFRRARDKAIADCPSVRTVRFHDARGQAIRNFVAKGLSAPEICAIVGHRDLKSMMSYFNITASEIAKKLD